jgi:energy-coupling factor transport system permease protein
LKIAIPHPVSQITIWICLAIAVQTLQSVALPLLALALSLIAFKAHSKRLLTLLRRTRWIIISILFVYAFMTPGVGLWDLPYIPSPTQEGLLDGLMQLSRLVFVLAGLSVLLTSLSQERMISGIYSLSYPVRLFGLSRERIAVRLALTLNYAEKAMQETATDWRSGIEHSLEPTKDYQVGFELPMQLPTWIDGLLFLVIGLMLFGMWR